MKHMFCIALGALVFGLCGCASPAPDPEQQRFDRIAASLEPGGTAYFVGSSAQVGPAVDRIRRDLERKLWNVPFPPEERLKLQSLISGTELLARLAGLPEIEGWGGSSKRLPDGLFRNRLRLLLTPEHRGVLWRLPGKENVKLSFGRLPEDTLSAGLVNVDTAAALRLLAVDKRVNDLADSLCKLFLGLTAKDFLSVVSGTWKFVIVGDEQYNFDTFEGLYGLLSVPDREGKLFAALCARAGLISGARVDKKAGFIQFPPVPGKELAPYVKKGADTLSVYSNPPARERTVPEAAPGLREPDFFVTAVAFFYNSNAENIDLSPGGPARKGKRPSWGILKRLPDGFLFEESSPCDLNEYAAISLSSIPAKLAFDAFSQTPPPPPPQPQRRKAPAPRRPAPPPARTGVPAPSRGRTPRAARPRKDACLNAVSQAGRALLKAAGPQKRFPAPGIAGLRELAAKKLLDPGMLRCPLVKSQAQESGELNYVNCHYLYFGKPGAGSPKSPLLMELPFLHRDYCAVFYADGSCGRIRVSEHWNVRRAISCLHTLHAYEEEEFFRLMKLAAEFDKILEL